jgi:hypothetical protein
MLFVACVFLVSDVSAVFLKGESYILWIHDETDRIDALKSSRKPSSLEMSKMKL